MFLKLSRALGAAEKVALSGEFRKRKSTAQKRNELQALSDDALMLLATGAMR